MAANMVIADLQTSVLALGGAASGKLADYLGTQLMQILKVPLVSNNVLTAFVEFIARASVTTLAVIAQDMVMPNTTQNQLNTFLFWRANGRTLDSGVRVIQAAVNAFSAMK